jgi:hypothetical protein
MNMLASYFMQQQHFAMMQQTQYQQQTELRNNARTKRYVGSTSCTKTVVVCAWCALRCMGI